MGSRSNGCCVDCRQQSLCGTIPPSCNIRSRGAEPHGACSLHRLPHSSSAVVRRDASQFRLRPPAPSPTPTASGANPAPATPTPARAHEARAHGQSISKHVCGAGFTADRHPPCHDSDGSGSDASGCLAPAAGRQDRGRRDGQSTSRADAVIIDGTRKYVTPGIIDVHSHLGVYAAPAVHALSDGNEATDPSDPVRLGRAFRLAAGPAFPARVGRRRDDAADPSRVRPISSAGAASCSRSSPREPSRG